jgi:putative phosphoribosyl transferase
MFRDRHDAALQLAERLHKYQGKKPLILGIPRGGVIIASVLARALDGDLDVVLTRKLGTPGRRELAMGSIDENGEEYLNESITTALQISRDMIEQEKNRQFAVIRRRAESYRRIYPKIPIEGRIVIITDDGIATGATMKVAVRVVKAAQPETLVVALPVGPPEQVAELALEADETVCMSEPPDFMAVGQFYQSFEQVEEDEVERILLDFAERRS